MQLQKSRARAVLRSAERSGRAHFAERDFLRMVVCGYRMRPLSPAILRSAASIRDCQPGLPRLKWSSTSRDKRIEIGILVGAFCLPRCLGNCASTSGGKTSSGRLARAKSSFVHSGLSRSAAFLRIPCDRVVRRSTLGEVSQSSSQSVELGSLAGPINCRPVGSFDYLAVRPVNQ